MYPFRKRFLDSFLTTEIITFAKHRKFDTTKANADSRGGKRSTKEMSVKIKDLLEGYFSKSGGGGRLFNLLIS